MTKWLHLRRTEVDVDFTPFEIREKLPEDARSSEDSGFECFRSVLNGFFSARFDWELVSQEDSYRLVEDIYVSSWFFFLTASVLVGLMVSTVATPLFSRLGFLLMFGLTVLFVFLFGFLIWVRIRISSPLQEVLRKGDNRVQYMPVASFMAGVIFLMVLLTQGGPVMRLLSIVGAVVLSAVFWRFNGWIAEWSFWWQKILLRTVGRLPGIFGNYLIAVLVMTGMVGFFLRLMQYPSFAFFFERSPLFFGSISAALFVFVSAYLLRGFGRAQQVELVQFDYYGLDDFSQLRSWTMVSVAALTSLCFAGLSGYTLVRGLDFAARTGSPFTYLVLATALLPFFYVVGGVIYQLFTFIYGNTVLLLNSENRDLEVSSAYPIRVLNSDVCMAGAVSLWFSEFIIVSEGLVDGLEGDQLEAVVAHEEAHFEYGDARLAFVVGLLASFAFTGRNVVFGVLGYRQREFRADRYACRNVGEKPVLQALDHLQDIRYEESPGMISGFSPTVSGFHSDTSETLWSRIYGFYYGNFALSNAHPSLNERKEAIRIET